jgi:hypothetical protein
MPSFSSKSKNTSSGTKTESGTTTPVLPGNLQTGLNGLVDRTNVLAGQDPYSLVAGPSSLQNQAFQGASQLGGGGVNWGGQTGGPMARPSPVKRNPWNDDSGMTWTPQPGPMAPGDPGSSQSGGMAPPYPGGQMPGPSTGWQGGIQRASDMAGQVANAPANLASAYGYQAPQVGQTQLPNAVRGDTPTLGQAPSYQALTGTAATADPRSALGYAPTTFAGAQLGESHGYDPTLINGPSIGPAAQTGGVSIGSAAQTGPVRIGGGMSASAGSSQGYGYDAALTGPAAQSTAERAGSTDASGLIRNFMNPYTDSVVNTTLADFDHNAGAQQAQQRAEAAARGAFGGSRSVIGENMLRDDQARARAAADANLRSQGFNTALGAAQQQADRDTGVNVGNADRSTMNSQFNSGQTNQNAWHNQDATNRAGEVFANNRTQSSIADAGYTTNANIANMQDYGQTQRAQGQLDSEIGRANTSEYNQHQAQQGLINADIGKSNTAEYNLNARSGADIGLRAMQGNQDATNSSRQFGAASANSFDLARSGYGQQAGMQSADLLSNAAQFGAQAGNQYGYQNLGNEQGMRLANLQGGNQALSDNAGRAGQYGLAQFGANADTSGQYAGAQNQFGLAGYQGNLQTNLTQAGLNSTASQFGANALNNNSQFNAGQQDNMLGRQMQAGALWGQLGSEYGNQQRGDLALQGTLGGQQRDIQQQYNYAPYTQNQMLGQNYQFAYPQIGQNTTGNSSFTGQSTETYKPSIFEMLMQAGQKAGQAMGAGGG